MRYEKIYYADDGTRFEGNTAYRDCKQYELELADKKYEPLKPFIQFYLFNGEPIRLSLMAESDCATFAHITSIPHGDNDKIRTLWNDVIPSNLDDEVYYDEDCGWWVSYEGNWYSWKNIINEFQEYEKIIKNIGG